jgi:hypothetical protein
LLERFPETDEDDEAEAFVDDLLREAFERFDIEIGDDAGEWVGDEAAMFTHGRYGLPTLLVAADGGEQGFARALHLWKQTFVPRSGDEYRGVRIFSFEEAPSLAYLDGFIVVGFPEGIEASIEATRERSLADDSRFQEVSDLLDAHRFATVYLAAAREPIDPVDYVLPALVGDAAGGALSFHDEGVVLDLVAPEGSESPLPLRGYVRGSLLDPDIALQIEGTTMLAAIAAPLAARTLERIPGMSVEREIGEPLTATTSDPDADGLLDPVQDLFRSGAGSVVMEGYEPRFAADLEGVPAVARGVVTSQVDPLFLPMLRQLATVKLGVARRDGFVISRVFAGFFADEAGP